MRGQGLAGDLDDGVPLDPLVDDFGRADGRHLLGVPVQPRGDLLEEVGGPGVVVVEDDGVPAPEFARLREAGVDGGLAPRRGLVVDPHDPGARLLRQGVDRPAHGLRVPGVVDHDVRDVRVRLPGDGVEGPREEHGAVVRSGYDRNGGVHPDPFVPIPSFCHSHPEGRPSRPSGPEVELISVWAANGPESGSPASIGGYEWDCSRHRCWRLHRASRGSRAAREGRARQGPRPPPGRGRLPRRTRGG